MTGVALYKAGKADRLLFTGGVNPFRPGQIPEGEYYLREAQKLGVPSDAVSTTHTVFNTADEAVALSQFLPARNSRILLVTSAFHMRRSQALFERQGFKVLPFPVDFKAHGHWAGPLWRDPTQWLPSASALDNSSRALRELLGRLVYWAW